MGLTNKAKDKAEELAGKGKATVGDKTDNPDLEAEGRTQEAKADVKQAGENVKDSGDDIPTPCVRPARPQSSTTKTPCVNRHNVEGPGRLWLDQGRSGPFRRFLAA